MTWVCSRISKLRVSESRNLNWEWQFFFNLLGQLTAECYYMALPVISVAPVVGGFWFLPKKKTNLHFSKNKTQREFCMAFSFKFRPINRRMTDRSLVSYRLSHWRPAWCNSIAYILRGNKILVTRISVSFSARGSLCSHKGMQHCDGTQSFDFGFSP